MSIYGNVTCLEYTVVHKETNSVIDTGIDKEFTNLRIIQLLHKHQAIASASASELYGAVIEILKELKRKNVEVAPGPED